MERPLGLYYQVIRAIALRILQTILARASPKPENAIMIEAVWSTFNWNMIVLLSSESLALRARSIN